MKAVTAVGALISLFAAWLVFAASPDGRLPPLANPPTNEQMPGKFVWFDLGTPAITNQRNFYGSVFGWTFDSPIPTDDGYLLIKNGNQPIAGMFRHQPPGGEQGQHDIEHDRVDAVAAQHMR